MAEVKKIQEMSYAELQTEYIRVERVIRAATDTTEAVGVIIPRDAHAYYGRRAEIGEHVSSYDSGYRAGAGTPQPGDDVGRHPERFEQGRQAAVAGANAEITSPLNPVQSIDEDARYGSAKSQAHAILEYEGRSPQEKRSLDRMLESKSEVFKHEGIVPAGMAIVAAAVEIRATEAVVKHYAGMSSSEFEHGHGVSVSR